jgi:DNA-directed RNA polymerase
MDASALMETVVTALASGLDSFAMVHDSYGTHARDTSALAEILRQAFVGLYKDRDILGDFRKGVSESNSIVLEEIPEAPKMGSLEIEGVFLSKYFFA